MLPGFPVSLVPPDPPVFYIIQSLQFLWILPTLHYFILSNLSSFSGSSRPSSILYSPSFLVSLDPPCPQVRLDSLSSLGPLSSLVSLDPLRLPGSQVHLIPTGPPVSLDPLSSLVSLDPLSSLVSLDPLRPPGSQVHPIPTEEPPVSLDPLGSPVPLDSL